MVRFFFFLFLTFLNISVWCQTQIGQTILGENFDDDTGLSVSISGDGQRVAVGAPDIRGENVGASVTKVLEWNGNRWQVLGSNIIGSMPLRTGSFDIALSDDGSRIAIGEINTGTGSDGQVRVLEYDGTDWHQVGATFTDRTSGNWIGRAVDLSADGNVLVFSEQIIESLSEFSGRVEIHSWTGSEWQLRGDTLTTESNRDDFGRLVRISADGNRIAVSALNGLDGIGPTGSAHVFEWNGIEYEEIGFIQGSTFGNLGEGLDMTPDGGRVVLSGTLNSLNGIRFSGEARVYEFNGNDWMPVGAAFGGDQNGQELGADAAISADGNTVVLASWGFNKGPAVAVGMVRTFHNKDGAWTSSLSDIEGVDEQDRFGISIDLDHSGTVLVAGAPIGTDVDTKLGYVNVYDLCTTTTTTLEATTCGSYLFHSRELTKSGTYRDTLQTLAGCDSVITLSLTVDTIEADIFSVDSSLTIIESDATFQWFECGDQFRAVDGADSSVFTPMATGQYTVEVRKAGCIDTASCFDFTTTSNASLQINNVHIFPNPTGEYIRTDISEAVSTGSHVEIRQLSTGKLFQTEYSSDSAIDVSSLPAGIYVLLLKEGAKWYRGRFVKMKG